jgi:hypothetical protein
MARPSYYVETPDGKKVQLDVPENASAEQIRTLAARALKQRFPEAKYGRPALSKEASQSLIPEQARGELTADDTAISRVTGGIQGALSGLGVDERYAAHVGNRATSALNDLTPVGDAITLSDARDAWNSGNYLGAIGRGALAGVGLIPGLGDVVGGAAKAMFLGVGAKNANLGALARAEELAASGADRKEIWSETGWFQGADNKWRFEVPDNELRLNTDLPAKERQAYGQARRTTNVFAKKNYGVDDFQELPIGHPGRGNANAFYQAAVRNNLRETLPFSEAVSHPALAGAYDTSGIGVGLEQTQGLNGSWFNDSGELRVRHSISPDEQRSVVAHELQHFVQGQEGFARGGMTGTIPAIDVSPELQRIQSRIDELDAEIERWPGETPPWALVSERDSLDLKRKKLRPQAEFEGYRRTGVYRAAISRKPPRF